MIGCLFVDVEEGVVAQYQNNDHLGLGEGHFDMEWVKGGVQTGIAWHQQNVNVKLSTDSER